MRAADLRARKIPIWRTVWDCYRFVFTRLPGHLVRGWFWVVSAFVADALLNIFALSDVDDAVLSVADHGAGLEAFVLSYAHTVLILGLDVVAIAFLIPVFIAWHRDIVTLHAPELIEGESSLFLYLAVGLVLFLVSLLLFAPVAAWLDDSVSTIRVLSTAALFILGLVFVLLVWPRLGVRLAATAVGREGCGWQEVWRAGQGNTIRLAVCDLLLWSGYLMLVIGWATASVLADDLASDPHYLIEFTLYCFCTFLEVTLLSLAYARFFGAGEQPTSSSK